jgi:hypothetical protein
MTMKRGRLLKRHGLDTAGEAAELMSTLAPPNRENSFERGTFGSTMDNESQIQATDKG